MINIFKSRVRKKKLGSGITVYQIKRKGKTRIEVSPEVIPFRFGKTKPVKGFCVRDRINELAGHEAVRIANVN